MFSFFLANAIGVLNSGFGSIISLLYAIFVVYGLYRVWTSPKSSGTKVLWSVAIFFLPFLGTVLYFLIGD